MKHIDEIQLENDLGYRFAYLTEFIGFGEEDIEAIHSVAEHLLAIVPVLVDAVYKKLFAYDAAKRHFYLPLSENEGSLPTALGDLTPNHELIMFRKNHLIRYLSKLVSGNYDDKLVSYLISVGPFHTPEEGNRNLQVPLVQMCALMGFVSDTLIDTILGLDIDEAAKSNTLRAFNKLFWLQNDLIGRHQATAVVWEGPNKQAFGISMMKTKNNQLTERKENVG